MIRRFDSVEAREGIGFCRVSRRGEERENARPAVEARTIRLRQWQTWGRALVNGHGGRRGGPWKTSRSPLQTETVDPCLLFVIQSRPRGPGEVFPGHPVHRDGASSVPVANRSRTDAGVMTRHNAESASAPWTPKSNFKSNMFMLCRIPAGMQLSHTYAARVTRADPDGRGRPYGQHLGTETGFSHDDKRARYGRGLPTFRPTYVHYCVSVNFSVDQIAIAGPGVNRLRKRKNHMAVFGRSFAFYLS